MNCFSVRLVIRVVLAIILGAAGVMILFATGPIKEIALATAIVMGALEMLMTWMRRKRRL